MASSTKKEQDKPAKVAINLDTMEREGRVDVPYVFVLGGDRYELQDPQEMDYRDVIAVQAAANASDFETAMALILRRDDRQKFFEHKIAIWKLEPLYSGWVNHYGLTDLGEADASPAT